MFRMKVVATACGPVFFVHAVGLLETFLYASLSITAAFSSSYTARCFGPPFTASQRGQHFLPEQADARARVLVRDETVRRPEPHDRRPRLLEQAAQLRNHGLRRAGDDLLVLDLVLELRAARIRAATDGVFDERRAIRRREVPRRARPHRMREPGELALHPHELPR